MKSVYSAVRTGSLNKAVCASLRLGRVVLKYFYSEQGKIQGVFFFLLAHFTHRWPRVICRVSECLTVSEGSKKNIFSDNNLQKLRTQTTAEDVPGVFDRRLLQSRGGCSFLVLRVSGFV